LFHQEPPAFAMTWDTVDSAEPQGRHAEVAERYAAAIEALQRHLPAGDSLRQAAEVAWQAHRAKLAAAAGK
jgi:hypothetical protein